MPRVTLTLEDQPDGTVKLSLESDPILCPPLSPAQTYALCAHQMIMESGGPLIAIEPVMLLDHYEVADLETLKR